MGFSPCSAREGDAREFAAKVGGVALAVVWVVKDGVDVVEDVPLGDGGVAVVGAELFESPIGDVFAAVAAVGIYCFPAKIAKPRLSAGA